MSLLPGVAAFQSRLFVPSVAQSAIYGRVPALGTCSVAGAKTWLLAVSLLEQYALAQVHLAGVDRQ